ncbi:MAG: rRNA pseudouridine synthase [Bacteroidales bacterium]|jgi:23S rRNA pseudouridine2605 synthase|nr:rRNA pseudouridine synthase [Bacteroidales bacterium]MBQ5934935.1 rRNA pseudouridine synthase [Bacteroidales bacterium]MBR4352845.1 rRNA pseudouridine synthase [Bacteroidales bacterium]
MENKRPYGRRKTDENRQTQPKTRRPYEKDEREKRPVRKTFTGKPTTGRPFTDKPRNYSPKPKKKAEAAEDDGLVRLNKFIANSGICSRREADTYIETGLVTVNGERVTELGTKIDPVRDDIRFNGQRIRGEKKVYLVMNKPKDFVTTLSDPHADRTVMDLISKSLCPERVFPVGRLDKATTGVLLLTNDGDLTEKLTHPKHEVRKIYHATLDKNLKKEDFDKILEGIELEDGPIAADALSYVEGDKSQVGLEIHSGRNRIVRRLFEHLGYKVKKLDRVYFAGLTKKNLRRGAWRFLEEKEIALLKMGAFQ